MNCRTTVAALATLLSSGMLQAAGQPDDASLKRGEYLSRIGDCTACHTAPGGKLLAGGLAMPSPIGNIYSTNITPDKKYGIGQYTLAEFGRAVREGIAKDGRALYPAMPYPSFAKVSDEDIRDLYNYFMHGVQPQAVQNKKTDIPWPLSIRWPLKIWNYLFVDGGVYQKASDKSEQWNRGAYLVQGLGHCGACHTPRGIAFQEKALTDRDSAYLKGSMLDGWYAPNLSGKSPDGLANWTQQDIVTFLKTGHTEKTAAFGSMKEVIEDSTQFLTNEDLTAIAVYLKSLGSQDDAKPAQAAASQDNVATLLASGDVSKPGAQLYIDNCAACHRTDGQGYKNTFPALAGNTAVTAPDPTSSIHIILRGSRAAVTRQAQTGLTMPDFAWRLNDEEVADLVNFIRNSWGNHAEEKATASQVKKIRAMKDQSAMTNHKYSDSSPR